jgi:hypothetical protein
MARELQRVFYENCYDADQAIAEYDGNNNLARKYICGPMGCFHDEAAIERAVFGQLFRWHKI